MNIENMKKLRTRLRSRKNPVAFDIGAWFSHNGIRKQNRSEILEIVKEHPCGTVACLAGHAAILAWEEGASGRKSISDTAGEFLGLDLDEADELFYAKWRPSSVSFSDVTRSAAIKELTRLIEQEEKIA